jgi:hypothetical protein
MTGSLNDIEFHCGIELTYHTDLRRVELTLNEVPHANRDPCVPIEADVARDAVAETEAR